jgi:predicted AlkP superfamily pyrophosphatase or phosphodiesterase
MRALHRELIPTRSLRLCALLLFLATACAKPAPPPASPKATTRAIDRVVIISIDGLRPIDCARLPTLGPLSRAGAFAAPPEGAVSVFPTVTYPSHTSMVTGVRPERHGIFGNLAPDSSLDGKATNGWLWFREDVRVPTVYDAALDAGLRTVLLQWPVTVGARATAVIPEYWVPQSTDDAKVLRLLSTPGVFPRIEARLPGFTQRYNPDDLADETIMDAAGALLAEMAPHLMLVHIADVDSAQHEFGTDSPQAEVALRKADTLIARLLTALQRDPAWPRTVLMVVSDHGFAPVTQRVAPYAYLKAHGLHERVWIYSNAGSSYFYLQKPEDLQAAEQTRALFLELLKQPQSGIGAVLERSDIARLAGDPAAFLAIEAAAGFYATGEHSDEAVRAGSSKGMHGYLPDRLDMRATLLLYGPKIAPSVLKGARLIDVAPTVAGFLGLSLGAIEGRPLAVRLLQ